MHTVAMYTLFGEKITLRDSDIERAYKVLEEGGVTRDWVYRIEVDGQEVMNLPEGKELEQFVTSQTERLCDI